MGETLNRYKIDNVKLSLEIKAIESQIHEYSRVSKNPDQLRRENQQMSSEIQQLEQQIASMRRETVNLESTTRMTTQKQTVQVYSANEIQKLESDVRSLQQKNQRLRQVLSTIGCKTTNVTTGQVRTEEIRDVEHLTSTVHHPLKESRVNESRVLSTNQRRSEYVPQEVLDRQRQMGHTTTTTTHTREVREPSRSPAPVRTTNNYTTTQQVETVRTSNYTQPVQRTSGMRDGGSRVVGQYTTTEYGPVTTKSNYTHETRQYSTERKNTGQSGQDNWHTTNEQSSRQVYNEKMTNQGNQGYTTTTYGSGQNWQQGQTVTTTQNRSSYKEYTTPLEDKGSKVVNVRSSTHYGPVTTKTTEQRESRQYSRDRNTGQVVTNNTGSYRTQ